MRENASGNLNKRIKRLWSCARKCKNLVKNAKIIFCQWNLKNWDHFGKDWDPVWLIWNHLIYIVSAVSLWRLFELMSFQIWDLFEVIVWIYSEDSIKAWIELESRLWYSEFYSKLKCIFFSGTLAEDSKTYITLLAKHRAWRAQKEVGKECTNAAHKKPEDKALVICFPSKKLFFLKFN